MVAERFHDVVPKGNDVIGVDARLAFASGAAGEPVQHGLAAIGIDLVFNLALVEVLEPRVGQYLGKVDFPEQPDFYRIAAILDLGFDARESRHQSSRLTAAPEGLTEVRKSTRWPPYSVSRRPFSPAASVEIK